MLFVYPAQFHKENEAEGYWVEFPDLPGCYTQGDTIEETMENAQEAMGLYIMSALEDGEDIPSASDIKNITTEDGFTSMVTAGIDTYKNTKSVKKTLTIPEWINNRAISMDINFSRVLQDGLIREIQKIR